MVLLKRKSGSREKQVALSPGEQVVRRFRRASSFPATAAGPAHDAPAAAAAPPVVPAHAARCPTTGDAARSAPSAAAGGADDAAAPRRRPETGRLLADHAHSEAGEGELASIVVGKDARFYLYKEEKRL